MRKRLFLIVKSVMIPTNALVLSVILYKGQQNAELLYVWVCLIGDICFIDSCELISM